MHDSPAPDGARRPGRARFLPDRVSPDVIEVILELARRAPSGVNTQPWNVLVLQGASRNALVDRARSELPLLLSDADAQARFWERFGRQPGSNNWPGPHWEQSGIGFLACVSAAFGARRMACAQDLEHYFGFDGAPVALLFTIDRALGLGSVLDYGMFLHNIAMAANARGLKTELQTGWRGLSDAVLACPDAPDDGMLIAALALGHADPLAEPGAAATAQQSESFTVWHD